MKTITLFILFLALFNGFGFFVQNNYSDTCLYDNGILLYLEVDDLPKFESDEFNTALEYIYSNIKYPSLFEAQGIVIVSFVVTKYGNIEKITIEKSLCDVCNVFDNEVKRVLLSMPKWIAGKKDNEFVNTLMFLPVNFKIQ